MTNLIPVFSQSGRASFKPAEPYEPHPHPERRGVETCTCALKDKSECHALGCFRRRLERGTGGTG